MHLIGDYGMITGKEEARDGLCVFGFPDLALRVGGRTQARTSRSSETNIMHVVDASPGTGVTLERRTCASLPAFCWPISRLRRVDGGGVLS